MDLAPAGGAGVNVVDRYIMAHIFGLTTIVALALMAIHTFITFVAEIDEIGRGGFGYMQLLVYTLWLMPTGLYIMLPIIAMLGTLTGLGALASQTELTAMRASGISLFRIGGATLGAGAVIGIFCLVLGDWLAPFGQQSADALKTQARLGVQAGVGGKPVWLREGEHVFHIKRLLAEDHIAAVEIYSLGPDLQLRAATLVDEGRYRDDQWHFTGIRRTEFGEQSARVVEMQQLEWPGTLPPEVLRLFVLEANALSMRGLVRLIRYLRANDLDTRNYTLTLARKLVAPFTVMAMMLFAVPFVLGPLRNTGAGQRLFIGVLIGLAFYVINEVTANTGQLYGWNALISAATPTLAFAGIGVWRLSRVH
jgi:lipopolysaccharide export system permease protein